MSVWLTSDLHLGHANIVNFCERPFTHDAHSGDALGHVPDVTWMNTSLLDRINAVVGPDDELWVLGDVAMGRLDDTLPLVKRLSAGKVVLVAGNHDRVHPCNGARAAKFTDMYAAAFDVVVETNTVLELPNGLDVQVSHFPYALSPQEARARRGETSDRFAAWRPVDDGRWLLCGHVHDAWRQSGRQVNVGVDAWGGRPVNVDEIVTLMDAGPRDLPALPW